jgi:hypothetical protein
MSDLGHSNIYLPLHTNLKEYNRYTLATKHNLVLKNYSKPSSHLLSSKRDKQKINQQYNATPSISASFRH